MSTIKIYIEVPKLRIKRRIQMAAERFKWWALMHLPVASHIYKARQMDILHACTNQMIKDGIYVGVGMAKSDKGEIRRQDMGAHISYVLLKYRLNWESKRNEVSCPEQH